jgi:hypothetical protein
MGDLVVSVVPLEPSVALPAEDLAVGMPADDLVVVPAVADMVVVPLQPDLAIGLPLQDLAVVATDIGPPGPQGVPGTGAATVVMAIAAQALGGQRVVKPVPGGEVDYASSDVVSDGDAIVGLTQGAVVAGAIAVVQTGGVMEDTAWNWIVGGVVYCGLNGVPTQTPPASGFMCRVGKALEPTKLYINVEEAVILI